MTYYGSEEHEPVTWWRGHPIYATHFVVLVYVASFIVTAILQFSHLDAVGDWLFFSSGTVLHGEVWRIFTYGLWNPPAAKGLWFAVDMLMLVWFGRELEKFFGRRKFLVLYGCLYLLTPLLFTVLGNWFPMTLAGETGAFAIFIAFATLYPNVPVFFMLIAKWVAIILVAIYSLIAFAARSWESLLSLWSTTAFAYAFVRYQQGHFTLPRLHLRRRKPKLRVLPDLPAKKAPSAAPQDASMAEVDALLDKIAQSGIGSLTAKERAKLEAAQKKLKNRAGS